MINLNVRNDHFYKYFLKNIFIFLSIKFVLSVAIRFLNKYTQNMVIVCIACVFNLNEKFNSFLPLFIHITTDIPSLTN